MSKAKPIKFNHDREYEWLIISQSYIQTALMSARILEKKLFSMGTREGSRLDWCLKSIYGAYAQTPEYLIFPIVFNFKHGIELYLKAMIGIPNSKFNKSHDLIELLNNSRVNNIKIKKVIKKYTYSKLLVDNGQLDKNNEFERYPESANYNLLDMFYLIDKDGDMVKCPDFPLEKISAFIKYKRDNNLKQESIVKKKIQELIKDIEFIAKELRSESLKILSTSKHS